MARATLWTILPVNITARPWSGSGDCQHGHVIRAQSEPEVRTVAASVAMDEGKAIWLDPERTVVTPLDIYGTPGIILSDTHAK